MYVRWSVKRWKTVLGNVHTREAESIMWMSWLIICHPKLNIVVEGNFCGVKLSPVSSVIVQGNGHQRNVKALLGTVLEIYTLCLRFKRWKEDDTKRLRDSIDIMRCLFMTMTWRGFIPPVKLHGRYQVGTGVHAGTSPHSQGSRPRHFCSTIGAHHFEAPFHQVWMPCIIDAYVEAARIYTITHKRTQLLNCWETKVNADGVEMMWYLNRKGHLWSRSLIFSSTASRIHSPTSYAKSGHLNRLQAMYRIRFATVMSSIVQYSFM